MLQILHIRGSKESPTTELVPRQPPGILSLVAPLIVAYMVTQTVVYLWNSGYSLPLMGEYQNQIERYVTDPICRIIFFIFVTALGNCAIQFLSLWTDGLSFQRLLGNIRSGTKVEVGTPSIMERFCRVLSGNVDRSVTIFYRCLDQQCGSDTKGANLSEASQLYAEFHQERALADLFLLNFFIWVLPIMGFIGTVWGISQAVGGLGEMIAMVTGKEHIQIGLTDASRQVLGGLSTAFDTTFLGLVFAVLVMIPLTILRRRVSRQALNQNDQLYQALYVNRSIVA